MGMIQDWFYEELETKHGEKAVNLYINNNKKQYEKIVNNMSVQMDVLFALTLSHVDDLIYKELEKHVKDKIVVERLRAEDIRSTNIESRNTTES